MLVFDSSHQHKSIYDSYNAGVAATTVNSIRLENASDTYSEFNTVKFDLTDKHDKHIMYSAFVAWICNESSIAPLSDYPHNPIYQEASRKNKYFTESDERLYIDLRKSKGHTEEFERVNRNDSDLTKTTELKNALTKKNRLRVTGYYQGDYMYMLGNNSFIMNYMEYGVKREKKSNYYQKFKIIWSINQKADQT